MVAQMKILLIGGNGFIGTPLAAELSQAGHQLAIFHRHAAERPANLVHIQGNRNRLPDSEAALRSFAPDVIIDLILSSGEQAQQLMKVSASLACRVVALSSMDVYRAWGVAVGTEPGPLEPLPITEDSPLRTVRQVYPREHLKMMQGIFSWVDDHYDKIAVEQAIMKDQDAHATILRLPMIYGPGDPLHRLFPVVKRAADGRRSMIIPEDYAAWRAPRGFVENVAYAIALAAATDRAAGRIYNVCEEPCLSELAWRSHIAQAMNWPIEFVPLPKERTPKHLWVPGNAAQHMVMTSDRIRHELGYREPIPTAEAIRRTVAWEQQNPPHVDPQQFDYAAEDAALVNAD